MGRGFTPTYIVRYRDQQGPKIVIWNTKTNGRCNETNLERWRRKMNESMKLGQCNEHISKSLGYMPYVSQAEIFNQKTNTVVCSVTMAMFEAMD